MLFYQGESGDITAVIRNKETQEVIPASTLNISVLKALLMDTNRRTSCSWLSTNNDFVIDEVADSFSWHISEAQTSAMAPGFYTLELSVTAPDTGTMIGVEKKIIQVLETNISKI